MNCSDLFRVFATGLQHEGKTPQKLVCVSENRGIDAYCFEHNTGLNCAYTMNGMSRKDYSDIVQHYILFRYDKDTYDYSTVDNYNKFQGIPYQYHSTEITVLKKNKPVE